MNEQNKKLEVLKNRCLRSSKIIGVLQIIIISLFMISFVAGVAIFFSSSKMNPILKEQIEKGNISSSTMEIHSALINEKFDLNYFYDKGQYALPIVINCLFAALSCLLVCFILHIFRQIFNQCVQDESPFSAAVLKRLKAGFIVITILITFSMGLGAGLIAGLLGWCLYSIFEYGTAIQTEVDDMV